jgi:serine/threonine protein kinase
MDLKARFEREARAISSLSHPHICTLYDVGRQDDIDYLVMEYLEGETLASRLTRGAMPPGQAVACAIEIAEALDAAHRQGIVHRDLKPGNVMLTPTGAKVLDFGLARLTSTAVLPCARQPGRERLERRPVVRGGAGRPVPDDSAGRRPRSSDRAHQHRRRAELARGAEAPRAHRLNARESDARSRLDFLYRYVTTSVAARAGARS